MSILCRSHGNLEHKIGKPPSLAYAHSSTHLPPIVETGLHGSHMGATWELLRSFMRVA